jgi:hypothetical protein
LERGVIVHTRSPARDCEAIVRCLFLLALAASGCDGLGSNVPGAADAGRIRRRFPAHAAAVLDAGEAFVPVAEGFALTGRSGASPGRAFAALLPRRGDGATRFSGLDFEVRVRERGARGEGAVAGAAVAYPRDGGTSFWRAAGAGYEEWLHLDAGVAVAGRVVAAWEIEGAHPSKDGDAIVLADDAGSARLMVTAPRAFAASGRPVRARLAAVGDAIELSVDAGGEEVLVDPFWALPGSMNAARRRHTATAFGPIPGRVLTVGGEFGPTATAEVYHADRDAWAPAAAPLVGPRASHTATALPDGTVLVAGGDVGTILDSVERFHAGFDSFIGSSWSLEAPMSEARRSHTATLLPDGRVLVAGGESLGGILASAEIYDPAAGTWKHTGPMKSARSRHQAVLLPKGLVLAMGGIGVGAALASAEIYDPSAGAWTPAAAMATARSQHRALLLPNGTVLVTGGEDGAAVASVEIFDPAPGTWKAAEPMSGPRSRHGMAFLDGGLVLVAGGVSAVALPTREVYDSATDAWSAAPPMHSARSFFPLTSLPDGRAVAVGGDNNGVRLATDEVYGPGGVALGLGCSSGSDCAGGFCAAGVCCDRACDLQCNTCAAGVGVCTPVSTFPFCVDQCGNSGSCLQGTCHGIDFGMCCGALGNPCLQQGSCFPPVGCFCPPFPDGSICPGPQGSACVAGACVAGDQPEGSACTLDMTCASHHCVDSRCCDRDCQGPCNTCAKSKGASADGTCTPLDGVACADGVCADGVCAPPPEITGAVAGGGGAGGGGGGAVIHPRDKGCSVGGPGGGEAGWAALALLGLGSMLRARSRARQGSPAPLCSRLSSVPSPSLGRGWGGVSGGARR